MLTLFLHSRTEWNDHFPGTISPNYNSQTYTSRQTPSNTNVYVSNCLFRSITSSDRGGALYFASTTYFLVESSSFFSCKTSSEGGAIYFSNSGGQSVLYKVCGNDFCTTNSNFYQFAFIKVNNAASSKNSVNCSSFSRCLNENSQAYHILGLHNGNTYCPSDNISLNKCYGGLGLSCWPLVSSNSVTCMYSFSSFADNIANGHSCVCFYNGGANYEIKSCNFLRNTQIQLDSFGTFYITGNAKIEDCCILENKANRIFHQGSSSYTITVSNCTVDKTSNNGYLTIQNTITKSFILALNHISTKNCHSEYDVIGILTPIIQTPSSSKKQILCYTYVKCLYQPRLSDFFSLTSVFIFHFIHTYASNDPYL
jgi:hypothetical protein